MSAVAQPSGTVTLVFTDIEGSTRLLDDLGEDGYRDALADHREVIRESFGRYGGYEVDNQGDSYFYAFPTATGAVGAVREALTALGGGPIAIRPSTSVWTCTRRRGSWRSGTQDKSCSVRARATCSTIRSRCRTLASIASRIYLARGGSTSSEETASHR